MPRDLAADVLEDILYRRNAFAEAFSSRVGRANLVDRDKAFAYNLVATTLRRLGQVDDLIDYCLQKPLPQKSKAAKIVLRLGVTQLFFMNVADHAAVNSSVDLAQRRGQGPYKKLINAILRRLGREGLSIIANQDPEKLNTRDWVWGSWIDTYGEEISRKIANCHFQQPPLDISVKYSPERWANKLNGELLPTGSVRLKTHSGVDNLPGFKEGEWWVQDAAAALPVQLFPALKGKNIADLCAAPGGKTAQLAAAGALVTAIDRSELRMKTLRENMDRLSLDVNCVVADAVQWQAEGELDGVLIDAPCSGTGTLRRHPDIQWIKSAGDVGEVSNVQRALLESSVEIVKRGGTIIFSTCSLQPEEGSLLISDFLRENANVQRAPITVKELTGLGDDMIKDGDLWTLPCHLEEMGGRDGFFAARLIRRY